MVGVFLEASKNEQIDKVYGLRNGINGIINDNLVNLTEKLKTSEDIHLLKCTPSTVLGSCRYKLPDFDKDENVYKIITQNFNKYDIKIFFYIGGNDSMDTVMKLSKYYQQNNIDIKVVGIPKTIDNDLPFTDHTPGFGSAAKYIATSVQEIIRDSSVYALESVTIVEIMGRNAGWLTASSALLKMNGEIAPHLIYLPEVVFDLDKFIEDLKEIQKTYKNVVVAVSEGLKLKTGDYVASGYLSGSVDAFGHQHLSGLGKYLESYVQQKIGCKVRSVELNVLQRCSSHCASKADIDEAVENGSHAVKEALNGQTGVMVAINRISNSPYLVEFKCVDVSKIANQEKLFPIEWISEDKNNIAHDAIEYFKPLIQGEVPIPFENGLPVHMVI